MLGETATAEFAKQTDAQGYKQNETSAEMGGRVAGKARVDLEYQLDKKNSFGRKLLA